MSFKKMLFLRLKERLYAHKNPKFIDFIITEKCNSKCNICTIWKKDRMKCNELSLDQIENFLDSIIASEVSNVDISGGEPLLHEDIFDMAYLISKKIPRAEITISTNALERNKIIKFLERAEGNFQVHLRISLDGVGDLHNKQRGLKDAFELTSATVRAIRERYPEQIITFVFTISPINYRDIIKTYDFVKSLGDYNFVISRVYDVLNYKTARSRGGDFESKLTKFDRDQKAIINKQLDELYVRYMRKPDRSNAHFVRDLKRSVDDLSFIPVCNAPFKMLAVLPSGKAYNCIMMKSIGNIDEGIDNLWNGKLAAENRDICKNKKCPGCMLLMGSHITYGERYG